MRGLPFFIALIALLGLAGPVHAGDVPLYAKQNCEAMKLAKPAFVKCYAANLAAATVALDKAYNAAMNDPGNDRKQIRDVERAWIAYKDKECAIENNGDATWKTNEDYGLRHAQCEIAKTESRIRELQLLTCEGASLCYPHVY
ncbi:MAG: DUF1311 domain-containing protein [Alphaproteobacteria bacterium]|nr:DUF1311 domain-containing protein [Alphaproteobacteria bacterium]MDE2162499.1 DUF1311 domain-containing protein [Alphaproteobacteria bacterium]MDE2501214.1 DUF1311 domain-containing protein [Alphaproteobacteria bacterium]